MEYGIVITDQKRHMAILNTCKEFVQLCKDNGLHPSEVLVASQVFHEVSKQAYLKSI